MLQFNALRNRTRSMCAENLAVLFTFEPIRKEHVNLYLSTIVYRPMYVFLFLPISLSA